MPLAVQTRATAQLCGTEKAMKHTYDDATEKWEVQPIYVRLDPTIVAEGTNRLVYNITDLSAPTGKQSKVAKAAKNAGESRQEVFKAVVMQKRCQRLAEKFNSLGAPKKVNFIDICVVELVQRPCDHTGGHPIMLMEPKLEGPYKKYSNNFGYVDKEDRNTPQAFSHFTFQYTGGKMIVVDIQGVKDNYTDPQIHSNIPESAPPIWGQGDMADTGIHKFFESHRCNALCKFFGLTEQPFQKMHTGRATNHNHGPALLTTSTSGMHLAPGYMPMQSNMAYSTNPYGSLNEMKDMFGARSTMFPQFPTYTDYGVPPAYSNWGSEMIVC